jgi:heme/copper-type cytochrome/quinol oxidase subunit 2
MPMRRSPLLPIAAFAVLSLTASATLAEGYESETSKIQVVSTLIGGKNVFIPSTIVVTGGQEHTLSLFNTTDVPHGFAIDALGVEAVLPPGSEFELTLPASEGGKIYGIRCHLHPPHRTATLVVVPAKGEAQPGSGVE